MHERLAETAAMLHPKHCKPEPRVGRGDLDKKKGPEIIRALMMVEVARIELASGSTRQSGLHA